MSPEDIKEKLSQWIPTNARIFGGTLLGETSPITEKNIKPEELAYLQQLVSSRRDKNAQEMEALRQQRDWTAANQGEWKGSREQNGQMVDSYYTPEDTAGYAKKLQSYMDTANKTSIGYDDFQGVNERGSGLADSFTSPGYNMMTTLGRFNAYQDPDGNTRIRDNYDWNKASGTPLERLKALTEARTFREFGNAAIRTFRPEVNRPIEINLGPTGK